MTATAAPHDKFLLACNAGDLVAIKALMPQLTEKRAESLSAGLREATRSANGGADVVDFLLDNDVDPNVAGTGGNTPVMIAAREGRIAKLAPLVDRAGTFEGTVNLNSVNKATGETALHLACKNRNVDVIRAMLPPNVDPRVVKLDVKDRKGRTPFQVLCENDNLPAMNEFLKNLHLFTVDDASRKAATPEGRDLIEREERFFDALSNAFRVKWGDAKEDKSAGKPLGEGGFGEVWPGTCPSADGSVVKVAIKVPLEKNIVKEETAEKARKDFWREIRHWALVTDKHHPNVLPLTGYAVDRSGNIKIMSPLGICSFFDWMWHQRKDPNYRRQSYEILRDIATGMAFIHNQQLVHGDLKPGNVILFRQSNGQLVAKVADFGLARVREDKSIFSSTKAIVAAPCFRAPEIANQHENPKIGKRKPADVWAFGMVCYSLSENGHEPFRHHAQVAEKLAAIRIGERPVCPLGTPADLVQLYELCCRKEWEQRPTSEEQIPVRPTFEDLIPVINGMVEGLG